MVKTKYVKNALVTYDDRYNQRWLDAAGVDVVKWDLPRTGINDDDTKNIPTEFLNTEVNTGTVINVSGQGGGLVITTDTAEYDGHSLQCPYGAFQLTSGDPLYFGAKVKTDHATHGDFLFGLVEVDTAPLATSSAHALAVTDDGLYFYKLTAGTQFYFVNELGGVEGATAVGATNDTEYHTYEFYWDGATLYVYFDDSLVTSIAEGLADQVLTPTFEARAGADGAEKLTIQWARAIQIF
jgi:hypothetical protein